MLAAIPFCCGDVWKICTRPSGESDQPYLGSNHSDDLQRAQIRGLPGYPHLAVGEWIGENDFVVRVILPLERDFARSMT